MPRNTKKLNIPGGGNINMNKNQDQLEIHVTQTCQWCYDDPSHVFPTFLPPGQVNPGTYGPYIPANDGKVTFDDPINPPCLPKSDTPHTITVSG